MMKHDDIDRRLGARIRSERESRGWSLNELAERANVSRAMIHKVERGGSSPTAQLLGKLSGAFGLSMSTLLARVEAVGGDLLRWEDQSVWTDPETGYSRRQISPRTDIPLDLVHVTLPAGKEVPMPACACAFLRQLIWVLEGDLVFVEGTIRHELRAGDCLHLGPPEDCAFRNEGQLPCTYALMVLRDR